MMVESSSAATQRNRRGKSGLPTGGNGNQETLDDQIKSSREKETRKRKRKRKRWKFLLVCVSHKEI